MALGAIHAVLDFLLAGNKGRRWAAEVLVSAGMMNKCHGRISNGAGARGGGIEADGGGAGGVAPQSLTMGMPLGLYMPSGASAGRPLAFIYEGEEELEGAAG